MVIEHNLFIEANIINNSTKFQLYPPYKASEELLFYLFFSQI